MACWEEAILVRIRRAFHSPRGIYTTKDEPGRPIAESTRCCALSVVSAASADQEHFTLCMVDAAMLLMSDIDSKDGLVLFTAQGNALAMGSGDFSGRLHPVKSRVRASTAKQKVKTKVSLIPQLCLHACVIQEVLNSMLSQVAIYLS